MIVKTAAVIPNGKSTAVSIKCRRIGTPNTIDGEAAACAVADMITRAGGDRLHEQEFLGQLLAEGRLMPQIQRVIGLDGVAEALTEIGTGHTRAKIVVEPES